VRPTSHGGQAHSEKLKTQAHQQLHGEAQLHSVNSQKPVSSFIFLPYCTLYGAQIIIIIVTMGVKFEIVK